MLSVENDVGYPISVGFSWDVFGFALGIVLCSFAGAILAVFRAQVDVIRAILISGASSVPSSDAGLESTLGASHSRVSVMLAIVVIVAWIVVGSGVSAMILRCRDV